jgi:Tfp pilus assembly protein PilX
MRHKISNYQSSIFNSQRGAAALLLTFFLSVILLLVALTAASIIMFELKMAREIANSVPAFFAADAGVEKCLCQIRRDEVVGECDNVGDHTTVNLSNGAIADAYLTNSNTLESAGTFGGANRVIEVTW